MAGSLDTKFTVDPSILSKSVTYGTTTAGDQATPILSAVAGKKIRILALAVSISIGGTNCYIRNSGAGSQITETFFRTLSGGQYPAYYSRIGYNGIFLYESAVGSGLVLNCTTAAAVVSVSVVYSYV